MNDKISIYLYTSSLYSPPIFIPPFSMTFWLFPNAASFFFTTLSLSRLQCYKKFICKMRHGIDGIFAHESSNAKSNFVIQKISLFFVFFFFMYWYIFLCCWMPCGIDSIFFECNSINVIFHSYSNKWRIYRKKGILFFFSLGKLKSKCLKINCIFDSILSNLSTLKSMEIFL